MGSRERVVLFLDTSRGDPVPEVVRVVREVAGTAEELSTGTEYPDARLAVDTPVAGEITVADRSSSASLEMTGEFETDGEGLAMGRYAIAVFDALEVEFAGAGSWHRERFDYPLDVESVLATGRLKLLSSSLVDEVGRGPLRRAPVCAVEESPDGSVALYDPPGVATSSRPELLDAVAGRFGPAVDAAGGGVRRGLRQTEGDLFDQLDALDGWNPVTAAPALAGEGKRAVEWLTDRLTADSPRVEASALRTLARLRFGVSYKSVELARKRDRENRADELDEAILAAGRAVGHPETGAPPTRIVDRLDHAEPVVRAAAAWSIAGDEALAHPDPLLELRGDPDERVRAGVAVALAKARGLGERSVFDVLREDDAWLVRATAAWALEPYGQNRAVRPLGVALRDDPHPRVRAAAADALTTYRGMYDVSGETLGDVARRLFDSESDDRVRAAALRMGKYGLTVGEVAGLAGSGGWILEREVARALSEGARAARNEENTGATRFRENARKAVDSLVELLDHDRGDLRTAAERSLTVAMTPDLAVELAGSLDTASPAQRVGIRRAVRDAWES